MYTTTNRQERHSSGNFIGADGPDALSHGLTKGEYWFSSPLALGDLKQDQGTAQQLVATSATLSDETT